jgi:copper homeostasis protein
MTTSPVETYTSLSPVSSSPSPSPSPTSSLLPSRTFSSNPSLIPTARQPSSPSQQYSPFSPASPSSNLRDLSNKIVLEICADSIESAIEAEKGGADRIELCSGLTDGGLTPSYGLISTILSCISIPVNVLIRPRPGDFLYTQNDINVMKADIQTCKLLGVTGVVIGALQPNGRVHREFTRELIECAQPMSITFHRAFDMIPPSLMLEELEVLIQMGVDRILTSGGSATALQGAQKIRELVDRAGSRCIILGGSGITEENVVKLLTATGLREVHASMRSSRDGGMEYRREGIYMGGEKHNNSLDIEYSHRISNADRIAQFISLANQHVRTCLSSSLSPIQPHGASLSQPSSPFTNNTSRLIQHKSKDMSRSSSEKQLS